MLHLALYIPNLAPGLLISHDLHPFSKIAHQPIECNLGEHISDCNFMSINSSYLLDLTQFCVVNCCAGAMKCTSCQKSARLDTLQLHPLLGVLVCRVCLLRTSLIYLTHSFALHSPHYPDFLRFYATLSHNSLTSPRSGSHFTHSQSPPSFFSYWKKIAI